VGRVQVHGSYTSSSSISGSWPTVAEKRTVRALSLRLLHREVRAANAASRIAYLYAAPQDVVMAPGSQEPPRRGKAQLEQNDYAGSCIGVSGKPLCHKAMSKGQEAPAKLGSSPRSLQPGRPLPSAVRAVSLFGGGDPILLVHRPTAVRLPHLRLGYLHPTKPGRSGGCSSPQ
jgi:hypothetical protein